MGNSVNLKVFWSLKMAVSWSEAANVKQVSYIVGWCHVVCALFIPEAWFGNVQTMEPIILKGVPPERFNKVSINQSIV